MSLGYHSLSEHDNSSTGMRITQSDELSFFIMPKTKRGNTAMKGKENTDTYRCLNCGWTMPAEEQGKEPDHCPNCLLAIHEEDREGNECGGILEPGDRESDCHGRMEPIGVWVRKSGEWAVIHRCLRCGKISSNRVAADDNPMKLMALAMRPFGSAVISKDEIRDMTVSMEK